jgi:protein SCO1/2
MRLLAGTLAALVQVPLLAGELPGDSVYHAGSTWTTQDDQTIALTDLSGTVQVISFVYTYCEHTCPTIVARLKAIDSRLPDTVRPYVSFTLVSLDPERDTPDVLEAFMQKRALDPRHWTMLHGQPGDVRELSAMLGVRYRPMGSSDFAHSNMITVLDGDGAVHYQMQGLSEDLAGIVEAIADAANRAKSP